MTKGITIWKFPKKSITHFFIQQSLVHNAFLINQELQRFLTADMLASQLLPSRKRGGRTLHESVSNFSENMIHSITFLSRYPPLSPSSPTPLPKAKTAEIFPHPTRVGPGVRLFPGLIPRFSNGKYFCTTQLPLAMNFSRVPL